MSDQPARIHRLRPNHREWSPPQVAFIDTETFRQDCPEGEAHTLRLWAGRLDVRRDRYPGNLGTTTGYGFTVSELADQLDIWTEGQRCLWVYAHNLSFDLAVTRLPAELHARGWEVTGHAVSSDSPWLRMKRGQCVLTFADSWGWLRAPLDHIGADVEYVKPDLPGWDDSDAAWLARCEGDVEILARAMLELMAWWDAEQLGSWTLTGSAGGWNTWRHRTTAALPLIVPDPVQTAADRAAIYGGRREAFRHGQLDSGPYALLDFKSAYPTVAAHHSLPAARQGDFATLPVDSPIVCAADYGIIAEVEIDTRVARYPVRVAGRVAYPVGRFRTTLAGPEIAEARDRGELVAIGAGYLHKLAPHMREWATWVLDCTADDNTTVPRVCQRAVKHWGRAVIGKSAAKGWQIRPLESLGGTGWDYRPAWNAELGAPSHLIDVCGKAAEVISDGDADNAYPAILAWVESWTRVYLSRAIDALRLLGVVTCDTDGLIVAAASDWRAALARADTGPLRLRQKGTYDRVRVLGPQHVISAAGSKMAGIPASAEPTTDGKLRALLWPKLAGQMQLRPGGTDPAYIRPWQTYTLAESYVTGYVANNGAVAPLRADICTAGQTHLIPWVQDDSGVFPRQLQASHLKQIIRPLPTEGAPCKYHTRKSNGTTGASNQSGQTPSSESRRKLTRRAVARLYEWRNTGGQLARMGPLAFYGKIRILSSTRTTVPPCSPQSECGPNSSTRARINSGPPQQCGKNGYTPTESSGMATRY